MKSHPQGPDSLRTLVALFAMAVAACGGGEGKATGPVPAPPTAPTPTPPPTPTPTPAPPGPAGCGLAAAAFCDTFDAPAPAPQRGRAGELDAARWSGSRLAPSLNSSRGAATPIGPATLRACRSGLPAQVFPPSDTLVCEANGTIASRHLMVAVGAQNYGQNSYRIRQPFDFAGRTGTVVFDADATVDSSLIGWVSVEVLEDPINAPSFLVDTGNDESGAVPRSGLEVQLQNNCITTSGGPGVGVRMVQVYRDHRATTFWPAQPAPCIATRRDHLNRFELRLSQQNVEVWGTPASADGRSFPAAVLLHRAAVNLPFSRGYVSITTHNHASLKYSPGNTLDAWVTRWDNVGFDGPVIGHWREAEVPDSLAPADHAGDRAVQAVSVGYLVADAADGPAQTLRLKNVDLTNAVSARLSVSAWYLITPGFGGPLSDYVLRYRLNGKTWRNRPLSASEQALFADKGNGQIGQMLEVPLSDLVQGDNTLEFVTVNVPRSYPPFVQNIDLVLSTR